MKFIHLTDVPTTIAHESVNRKRFISPGELQSKIQTVNYAELSAGESYTPHLHPDCEEFFFVLEGEAHAQVGASELILKQGDFLVVEPNEMHSFSNSSISVFKYFQFRVLL